MQNSLRVPVTMQDNLQDTFEVTPLPDEEEDVYAPVPLAPGYYPKVAQSPKKIGLSASPGSSGLLGDEEETTKKPKRPLTAYNLFFQNERQLLLGPGLPKKQQKKVGFADMARIISRKWKDAGFAERAPFCNMANIDKLRYLREMDEYREELNRRKKADQRKQKDLQLETEMKRKSSNTKAATTNMDPSSDASIADLALKLDNEMKQMIIHFFG